MAKWKSVTGLYPIGHLPGTELVGVKRGSTYYARAYVVPSNPKSDAQRIVRAAHMVVGNALYKMSKDPVNREWKRTLRTITGVNDIRRAWISLVARAYDHTAGTFNFPPFFKPISRAWAGEYQNQLRVEATLTGDEIETIVYAAVGHLEQGGDGKWTRSVDVFVPSRVHTGEWGTDVKCTTLANKSIMITNDPGDNYYQLFMIKVIDEVFEFWDPNGNLHQIHPVEFGYVGNLAGEKDVFTYFGPAAVVHQDWTGSPGAGLKYVEFSAPRTLQPMPNNYPYYAYLKQVDIIDGREPQTCNS